MRRDFELPAICLLMFTAVLVTAMAIDPKGFSVQAWQPLMAALIALGGASIVYRGATLAYQAAMAKVNHDREQAERERYSERLSLFVRLTTSLYAVLGDIAPALYLINERQPDDGSGQLTINARQLRIYNPAELSDAWAKLHLFPPDTITEIAVIKELLERQETEFIEHKDDTWVIGFPLAGGSIGRRVPEYLKGHAAWCKTIRDCSGSVIDKLEKIIPSLRKFD